MTDNVVANPGAGGVTFATDEIAGIHFPFSKLAFGPLDTATVVAVGSGLPVTQDGAWAVSVSNFPASVEISNDAGNPLPVSGTLTAVTSITNVVHVDDNAASLTVDGTFLTDAQLRATPVPISGTVTANAGTGTFAIAGAVTQSGAPWSENITQVGGAAIALGSALRTAAIPVTLANDDPMVITETITQPDRLGAILIELRTIASCIRDGLNVRDDLDALRADNALALNTL